MNRSIKILNSSVLVVTVLLAARASGFLSAPPGRKSFAWTANRRSSGIWWITTPSSAWWAPGFGFTEGPVWDEAGFLYVSDETINKIYRLHLDGRKEEVISLGDPDGNTFDRQRRLIDCASVLRAIIEVTPDGKYKILADHYDGKKFNSPNDVIVGPDGALYFTDPTLDLVAGEKQEIPFQGVYRLDAKGNVQLLTKDLTQPNGLAFSPDGKHFYVDDSELRNIRVYDVSPDGTLAERPHLRRGAGRQGRWCTRWDQSRQERQPVCHRTKRHLGLGRQRQPSRHNRDARAAGESDLGRQGLSNSLPHGHDLGIPLGNEDARLRALPEIKMLAVRCDRN